MVSGIIMLDLVPFTGLEGGKPSSAGRLEEGPSCVIKGAWDIFLTGWGTDALYEP